MYGEAAILAPLVAMLVRGEGERLKKERELAFHGARSRPG